MTQKTTPEVFIQKARAVHGSLYDYSLVKYKNTHTKVKIFCKKHGIFKQLPVKHLQGSNCPACAGVKKHTKESFIEKANEIHQNKYNYSLVHYFNNRKKVKIICNKHGPFNQTPTNHLTRKAGCPACVGLAPLTTKTFIKKAKNVHGEKYDYSLVKYKNITTPIKIICPIHGSWITNPTNHIHTKTGCPKCNFSHGEKQVMLFLEKQKIHYIPQYIPYILKNLKFDFFIPEKNVLIEFDGLQHDKFVKRYHKNKQGFLKQQQRDQTKTNYANSNNIKLLRIKQKDIKQIDSILEQELL